MTLTATGVTYTPAANFIGTDTFTYTISDGNGGTATATVTVTVTAVNDNPAAVNDTATVAEDSAATAIDVLANDTFAPDTGETLTVTAVTQGRRTARVTFTATGVSYTPAANFFGPDTFTYTISDGNGGTATATVTVTVTQRQRQPGREPDDPRRWPRTARRRRSTCWPTTRTAPDSGETLTVTAVTQGANGIGDARQRRRPLHAGRELLRAGQLHLHDQRRQRRDRDGARST